MEGYAICIEGRICSMPNGSQSDTMSAEVRCLLATFQSCFQFVRGPGLNEIVRLSERNDRPVCDCIGHIEPLASAVFANSRAHKDTLAPPIFAVQPGMGYPRPSHLNQNLPASRTLVD